jgi:hypothetical protein
LQQETDPQLVSEEQLHPQVPAAVEEKFSSFLFVSQPAVWQDPERLAV